MGESISDKIAGILSAAPTSEDPEHDVHKETVARVEEKQEDSESDQELRPSGLRKQNVDLLEDLDKRYEGQTSSRKKLLDPDDWESEDNQLSGSEKDSENEVAESDSNEDINEDDSDDEVGEDDSNEDEDDSNEAEDDSNENEDDSNEDEDDDDSNNEEISSASSDEEKKNFKHLSTFDNKSQISKGLCVRQQLNIWENFLEMRIQMQKCLTVANRLPQAKAFNEAREKCGPEFTSKASDSRKSVMNLLDKLLLLQELLVKKYPETKKIFAEGSSKEEKPESDEEIPSDSELSVKSDDENGETPRKKRKLNDYSAEISKRHSKYKDYRNSVIQKWNDKTRIFSSKPTNTSHSVVNHIEHILSDKDKLIKRTQLKRTDYEILGDELEDNTVIENDNNQSSEVYNKNIFDDTDFYHHLLRELIEFKSADVTDPVQLSRQWVQLQNLRSKMKRKIDTKATKGRKIRYVVHSKLVNFMAPIDEGQWQDEAKSELFSSLFGKNQGGYSN